VQTEVRQIFLLVKPQGFDILTFIAGNYGGIIVATSSVLDASLSAALDSYQIAYGVRKVVLYAAPEAPAMQLLGSASSQQMYFKIQEATYTKGVQLSFYDSIPFGYVSHSQRILRAFSLIICSYTASVLDLAAATPVIIGKLDDGTETVVAAEIHTSGMQSYSLKIISTHFPLKMERKI
jgi:hypothetical protein